MAQIEQQINGEMVHIGTTILRSCSFSHIREPIPEISAIIVVAAEVMHCQVPPSRPPRGIQRFPKQ